MCRSSRPALRRLRQCFRINDTQHCNTVSQLQLFRSGSSEQPPEKSQLEQRRWRIKGLGRIVMPAFGKAAADGDGYGGHRFEAEERPTAYCRRQSPMGHKFRGLALQPDICFPKAGAKAPSLPALEVRRCSEPQSEGRRFKSICHQPSRPEGMTVGTGVVVTALVWNRRSMQHVGCRPFK